MINGAFIFSAALSGLISRQLSHYSSTVFTWWCLTQFYSELAKEHKVPNTTCTYHFFFLFFFLILKRLQRLKFFWDLAGVPTWF